MKQIQENESRASIEAEITELETKLKERGGLLGPRGNLPPEMRLAFLKKVYAVEMMDEQSQEPKVDLEKEVKQRLELPPDPDALADDELASLLHELIELLASFHLLLDCTDHLSDRELYLKIMKDVVTDPLEIGKNPGGEFIHQDCCPYEDDKEWPDDYPPVSNRDCWIRSLERKYLNKPIP